MTTNNKSILNNTIENAFDGVRKDKYGIIMVCLPKYSNCQLCKYKDERLDSKVCSYCADHNKNNEYYI